MGKEKGGKKREKKRKKHTLMLFCKVSPKFNSLKLAQDLGTVSSLGEVSTGISYASKLMPAVDSPTFKFSKGFLSFLFHPPLLASSLSRPG